MSDASEYDWPGQVGPYAIEEEIARGGTGVVLRGRDADFGRTLAVKVLLAKHEGKAELEHRFLEEAHLTAQLQHPGIPPIHALGKLDDGRPYFSMKLVKGRTLAELLKERQDGEPPASAPAGPNAKPQADASAAPADLPRFLKIFEQVAQTVAYAHSRGIIHRDLKPANIMVGAFGEVQVMDWGLAKVLGAKPAAETLPLPEITSTLYSSRFAADGSWTQPGTMIGTLGYMAPEQARGLVHFFDERTDVFGLGAIVCVMLTGAPPFVPSSSGRVDPVTDKEDVYRQSVDGNLQACFERLSRCGADAEVIDLARRCLSPRKEERPRHAGEVAGAVAAYQVRVQERLRQAELDRATAQVKADEERKRRRLTVALATTLLGVLIGSMVVIGWYLNSRAERQTERAQRIALLERDTEIGLSELRHGRFASAENILALALERLKKESAIQAQDPTVQTMGEDLQKKLDRVRRLAKFYDLADQAERFVAEGYETREKESDNKGKALAEQALQELNVLSGNPNWWRTLPGEDLEKRQREKLERDAYRMILFLAAMQAKEGVRDFGAPALAPTYQSALKTIALANAYQQDAYTTGALEVFCNLGLGNVDKVRPVPPGNPTTPAGYYFLGMLHAWIAMNPFGFSDTIEGFVFRQAKFLGGLDLENPRATAIQYLKMATHLDSQHYWSHFWLGLALGNQPELAELSFDACVALRPDFAMGYGYRAKALMGQSHNVRHARGDKAMGKEPQLFKRAFADLDSAIAVDPSFSDAYFWRGQGFLRENHVEKALLDFNRFVKLEPTSSNYRRIASTFPFVEECFPHALAFFTRALELQPSSENYLGRGDLYLLRDRYKEAIADFSNALRYPPEDRWPDARYQRALCYLQTGKYAEAVQDFKRYVSEDRKPRHLFDRAGHQALHLESMTLTDSALAHLRDLKELRSLFLNNAKITDDGLAFLGEMEHLRVLELSSTNITDAGLTHLKTLQRLEILDLGRTKITDRGLAYLSGLAHLRVLSLPNTRITDNGLACIKEIRQLQELNLSHTQVTDNGLIHLKGLGRLARLYLDGTKITDAGLNHIKELRRLQDLMLTATSVTDSGLASLKELKGLRRLVLYETYVSSRGAFELRKALPKLNVSQSAYP